MTRVSCRPARAVRLVAALVVLAACSSAPALQTIEHGGPGPPTLVLLHGFGATAAQWAPFTRTIAWPAGGRFVFPEGPGRTVPPRGPVGGRAWWPLDLRADVPPGESLPDLSHTRPDGLADSADLVQALLSTIARAPGGPVVLGGFSQGAMLSSEVAFRSDTPLQALVLLSGTLVDEASWRAGYSRRRGLRVFVAHGRADRVLPFALADRMRRELSAAGADVTWHAFDGGHEMPGDVIGALNAFLSRLPLEP